jgi:hypothetical protein
VDKAVDYDGFFHIRQQVDDEKKEHSLPTPFLVESLRGY